MRVMEKTEPLTLKTLDSAIEQVGQEQFPPTPMPEDSQKVLQAMLKEALDKKITNRCYKGIRIISGLFYFY